MELKNKWESSVLNLSKIHRALGLKKKMYLYRSLTARGNKSQEDNFRSQLLLFTIDTFSLRKIHSSPWLLIKG